LNSTEKKNKIFIIGFMGSGKTTLGKKIAHALGYEFSDLDQYIESMAAQTISSIFEQQGESEFRKLESECLSHYDHKKYMVIATGGGTPCYNDNMDKMLGLGCCVYIKMPEGALLQRLQNARPNRPLLSGLNNHELQQFIHDTLMQRESYYLRSHMVFDGMKLSTPSLISLLKNKVAPKSSDHIVS